MQRSTCFPGRWDDLVFPARRLKLSDLGHAGVLFINGRTGLTKYYEYGRYDRGGLGLVRRVSIPNAMVRGGALDRASLGRPLAAISEIAGHGGRIEGCYIEVENKFDAMLAYAERRKQENANPRRRPYDITRNSCIHFVKAVVAAAGVDTPWMVDPRPNSYIGEFRDDFPDLDYRPSDGRVVIEDSTAA